MFICFRIKAEYALIEGEKNYSCFQKASSMPVFIGVLLAFFVLKNQKEGEWKMLKEKVALKFEYMEEAIEALKSEHKKYDSLHERELIKETLKTIIKKIESVDGANQATIENKETWGYNFDDEFYVVEKYEKQTSAGASMYDERLHAHVEIKTEELELEFQLEYDVETRDLIDAPFRHESFGTMSLRYEFN